MVSFETVEGEEVKFGSNNFIEVAKKRAVGESIEREFYAISRGFYLPDGSKRFKSSITLPEDANIRKKIADLIKKL